MNAKRLVTLILAVIIIVTCGILSASAIEETAGVHALLLEVCRESRENS